MKILAIDTSTEYLGLAIAEDDKILGSFREGQGMKHSSLLMPSIDGLLAKCHLRLKNIEVIALSIGPGSFTGLRIGVAACKGINLVFGTPIVDVPTLDAIAYNFINEKERILCPLIDAKKGKLYACFYERPIINPGLAHQPELNKLTDYMLTDLDYILGKIYKPTVVFGDGVALYGADIKKSPLIHISTENWFPKADVVAKLGLAKAAKRQFANPDKLVPMYLHSMYCQVKK
ncbi:MAG: tRNA (adenosine(37)-N6)-threonylcarbamoyltransferase complex dimerization subunit type 1 TsaB [Omnitrophica bacterium RBG_13_46_9]|nr:MAG: tRNA (adenosine(37)-N6)-threonylcarbamoyltransferase complex dimerization subunit type 1 TsaB [Omnitrophica bacterium RBG_13_46_9]